MKKSIITIGLAFLTVGAFAQKKEIKNALKATEAGKYSEAKNLLQSVESMVATEKDKVKADFYLAKGNAFMGDPKATTDNTSELVIAAKAFKKAIDLGEKDAEQKLALLKAKMINSAVEDQKASKFSEGSKKLIALYELDKSDTLSLYNAASLAVAGKDYDKALEYYLQLDEMGYEGTSTIYTAVNKETNEVESFANKNQRDIYLKSGTHIKPETKQSESKRPEIIKNIALIYVEQGNQEKAMTAIAKAKEESPNDTALLLSEADIYHKMDKMDKYSETVERVLEIEPNNPVLYYNLGVSSMSMGATQKAINYYKQAIKLDPDFTNAYVNLASAILDQEKPIVEEMNKLGMSDADTRKYNKLQEQRLELYKKAVPYLEKVLEKEEKGTGLRQQATQTLKQIYSLLGETQKAKALQD
ncbi:tetratricopeptide repeat protein [Mesonia sp. HuA40]|uniref:tetratricopeptide repeat protein n=1 Tax=Mesonia sp. HuA40 TaxID=2602761 RepID=UPI0011C8F2CA|nr:tetratricopeptide repeat protein [Mesonia sp. HuA40]TXK70951.1 tetratricopeptide repeat protein [Mesonia sp. HuA40]